MMTTMSAMLGAVPIALGYGAGARRASRWAWWWWAACCFRSS